MDAPDYLSICPTLSLCAAQRLYLSFYCSVGESACRGVKHGSVPPLHVSFNTCKLSLCPHQSPLLEATNSGETSKMLFPCCFQSRYMDICHFSSLPKESSSQPPSHKFTELEKMHLSFVHVQTVVMVTLIQTLKCITVVTHSLFLLPRWSLCLCV